MPFSLTAVTEALVLASSLSMDTFAAGFAYGSRKIKIPLLSALIISLVCGSVLGLSLLTGAALKSYIPARLTVISSFVILLVLGITKLLDSITKTIIRRHSNIKKEIKFSMFNFKFILKLYADPEEADVDSSSVISPAEAVSLAIALSLDGLAVGLGAGLASVSGLTVFVCSLLTDFLGIILGCCVGNKAARKINFNMSWVSGAVLIIMAFLKLF